MEGTVPAKRSLFQIGEEELVLLDRLLEAEGELDGPLEEWFVQIGEEKERKLNSIGWLIRKVEGENDTLTKEINRLSAFKKTNENIVKRIKERILTYLTLTNQKNVETDHFKFARQANGGKNPVVVSEWAEANPSELGERYSKVTWGVDTENIREDLERKAFLQSQVDNGFVLEHDGAVELEDLTESLKEVAYLGERSEHLRVR